MLTRTADIIKTKIDHRERASICGRFREKSAILHCHLEESPGIELLSVVVDCQELGSTAWSIGLIRATAKARVFLVSVQGGLTSPNLTVAEHLLDFDRRWNSAIENSVPHRVLRIDQKNERKGTAH